MAFTVDAAFAGFYEAINLSGDHRDTANARKDRIVGLLENKFEILDAFSTGSIPKCTALRKVADLDVMAVLHFGKHVEGKTPAQLLSDVREALAGYSTRVRRNGQAVTLSFETWPNVDIVPVSRVVHADQSVNYYNVPDANRGVWLQSRPRKMSADIESKSSECGENFRRIIKMAKHWNSTHSDYLSSYHIEVLALKIFSGSLADLPWSVFQFFDKAKELVGAPLWYELGYADDYLAPLTRGEAVKRLHSAADTARNAWVATYGGRSDHQEAIRLWQQIFGDKFPAYG